jgi:hypothetical protein
LLSHSTCDDTQWGLIAHLTPCVIVAAPVIRMVFGGLCYDFENYAMLLGAVGRCTLNRADPCPITYSLSGP